MDIEHLGYKTIDQLLQMELIHDPADIFTFDVGLLGGLDGWGEVSVRNLSRAIEAGKDRPVARLLTALGIRHVGSTVARTLAGHFGSMSRLMDATEDEIAAVAGIGPVIGAEVRAWSADPINRQLVEKLGQAGVRLADPVVEMAKSDDLAGVTVVISGTLADMTREEAEAAVVARGGKTTGSVSAKTSALVVGESPGASKTRKAEEVGVPIIDEITFKKLLDEGPSALPSS
jgi:DNA ligase (NAD+)